MNFSLQSPPPAVTPPAPTRDLPQLDRPTGGASRKRGGGKIRWLIAIVALGAAGVMVAGSGLGKQVKDLFAKTDNSLVKYTVSKASIPVTVVERGQLESAKNQDVASDVEGTPQII